MRDGQIIIVHVSDLHRGSKAIVPDDALVAHFCDDVTNGYKRDNEQLPAGAPRMPMADEVDVLVVSGDLTATAERDEFESVEAVLERLRAAFPRVDRERVIVVPGNHDVSWVKSRAAYTLEPAATAAMQAEALREESELRLDLDACPPCLYRRATQPPAAYGYDDRLAEFCTFYERYYQTRRSFSLHDRTKQFGIFDAFTQELGVVIVGFSSCDANDHLWRRGRIHPQAILEAASELDRRGWTRQRTMRVAVWHHNVHGGPYQLDFLDSSATHLLAEVGFSVGLHGHLHEVFARAPAVHRRDLLVLGAGSMSARRHERPDSVPLQYNVISLDPRTGQGWVHIRSRTPTGTWGGPAQHGAGRNTAWLAIEAQTTRDVRFFPSVEHSDFSVDIERRLSRSRQVCFVGAGLNALTHRIRSLIVERARTNQFEARICFGNPYAPDVRARLVEEERGDVKPDVAADGILNRASSLVEQARGIPGVRVSFFNNYPTLSVFRFDDVYYSYPMGYRRLGNTCPALRVETGHPYAQFLDDQIDKYLADSVDADELLRSRERMGCAHFAHPERIRQLAVFVIPPDHSLLCQEGNELIGLSSRGEQYVDGDLRLFRRFTREAAGYGLHVTVVDVMYVEESQLAALTSEVCNIARRVAPFPLTLDSIEDEFSWRHNVVIRCSDRSGNLERLHFELSHRLLPVCLGTNYTLNSNLRSQLQGLTTRDELFLHAYHTPYVFQRYRPHITLASGIDAAPEDRAKLRAIAERRLSRALSAGDIPINSICVLHRGLEDQHWKLTHFPLGRGGGI